jgi:nucleoid DNA-binding protein
MAKEKPATKPAAKAAAPEKKPAAKAMTKSAFIADIAEKTELSKQQVSSVFETMSDIIMSQLSKKGPGVVAIPGLLKLKAKHVAAVKGGQKVPNRFKPGEMTETKAKPAHMKVSARPLKGLKDSLK